MPYIKTNQRRALEDITTKLSETFIMNFQELEAGTLNYLFTCIAKEYIRVKGESYKNYNDILGAMEGAKLELYRRQVSSYEQKAIEKNGDI